MVEEAVCKGAGGSESFCLQYTSLIIYTDIHFVRSVRCMRYPVLFNSTLQET